MIKLFRNSVLCCIALGVPAASAVAQANPQVTSARAFYTYMKGNVLKTAQKVPEDVYSYQANREVRTFGQILAHIADAQGAFCGLAKDGTMVEYKAEERTRNKAQIIKALNESFDLCDAAYAAMTDANSSEMVTFRAQKFTKLSMISFNTAHGLEHYGNLVVYMRLNKILPPSSEEPPKPEAPKPGEPK